MTGGNIIAAEEGLHAMAVYRRLKVKEDKTEEEWKAVKSYQKIMLGLKILIPIILAIAFVGVSFMIKYISHEGVERRGTYEQGNIRYVQNEIKYVAPHEIGLGGVDLQEGERVHLYFNRSDQIIGAETEVQYHARERKSIVSMLAAILCPIIILLVYMVVAITSFGEPWYLYYGTIRRG